MAGPNPRQQLLRRCERYLARQTGWYWNGIPPEYDNRPSEVRGFRTGGDDLPEGCLTEETRKKRPIHRLTHPGYPSHESRRLDNDRASRSDAEVFALAPWAKPGLTYITAVLAQSANRWRPGTSSEPHLYFDVGLKTMPPMEAVGNALTQVRAWFERVGFDIAPLKKPLENAIGRAPWHLDEFFQKDVAKDITNNPCVDRFPDLKQSLVGAFEAKLNAFTDANHVPIPSYPPTTQVPLPPDGDACSCEPVKSKDDGCKPPFKWLEIDVTLPDALARAKDALLAVFGDETGDELVKDFRELSFPDPLIARLVLWMASAWSPVTLEQRRSMATYAWNEKHDLMPFHGASVSLEFSCVPPVFYMLRAFARISRKRVDEAFLEYLALMQSKLFEGWSPGSREGEQGVWKIVDKAIADARRFLDPTFKDKDALPHRIKAFYVNAETYLRILHEGMQPANRIPVGESPGKLIPSPGLTPLDAFYWRHVIMESTFKDALSLAETADFGMQETVRFLGLFRRGGQLRPAAGDVAFNEEFETWLTALIPDWFINMLSAAVLRFKYWIDDDPTWRGDNVEMTFWSENHQISYASSEYAAGVFFPAETFIHAHEGAHHDGNWHRERAQRIAEKWLMHRLRFGFSEVNSPVYYNVQIPALLNLLDFIPTLPDGTREESAERLRTLTLMVLDVIVFDVVLRVCQGSFVSAAPRGYLSGRTSGWGVSIRDFIEVLTGTLGEVSGSGETSAVFFATSRYRAEVPECLILIAREQATPFIARTRTSIDMGEAGNYGIGFDSAEDIMFWWAHSAFFTEHTYRSSQSWAVRWNLGKSGPFKIFEKVDGCFLRLLTAVVGGLTGFAVWAAFGGFYTPMGLLMTPRILRSLVDMLTSVLDVISGIITEIGKGLDVIDENSDRMRLAYTAFEQEFRRSLIEFNAGSLMEREHLYVWRSADAMLSSLVDDHKQMMSAQKQTCIANLGPDVNVFVTKPLEADIDAGTAIEGAAAGMEDYLEFWNTIPGSLGADDEPVAPELGELTRVVALGVEEDSIFEEGPTYWNGSVSNPLVWQRENVAISMFKTTAHQRDLSNKTHAHWPWDHFDEFATVEASGGRWVFGRRNRRFPPRTPCKPRAENRPGEQQPWPREMRRGPESDAGGAGYVALFSANGMRPVSEKFDAPFSDDDAKKKDRGWARRDLIADGDDNIWITVVGDELTYGSFKEFKDRVLACELEADVDDGTCTFELPALSGPKHKMEVTFDDGSKINLPATEETPLGSAEILETANWPKFSITPSRFTSGPVRFGVWGGEKLSQRYVGFDDKAWKIYAMTSVPSADDPKRMEDVELSVSHDISDEAQPRRNVFNLPIRLASAVLEDVDSALAQSRVSAEFRADRKQMIKEWRSP